MLLYHEDGESWTLRHALGATDALLRLHARPIVDVVEGGYGSIGTCRGAGIAGDVLEALEDGQAPRSAELLGRQHRLDILGGRYACVREHGHPPQLVRLQMPSRVLAPMGCLL